MQFNIKRKKKIKQEPKKQTLIIEDLKVGQVVKSIRFSMSGEIQSINHDKKEIEIESKGVKFKVPLEDLQISENQKVETPTVSAKKPVIQTIENEIDLRGMQSDDALIELERYLDIAQHSGWNELRIIHGKGTGALRKSIHLYLRKNSLVKSFSLAKYGQGDTGVTVLNL